MSKPVLRKRWQSSLFASVTVAITLSLEHTKLFKLIFIFEVEQAYQKDWLNKSSKLAKRESAWLVCIVTIRK